VDNCRGMEVRTKGKFFLFAFFTSYILHISCFLTVLIWDHKQAGIIDSRVSGVIRWLEQTSEKIKMMCVASTSTF
jgi:hypothetical protein